jgi:trans-aconitate methyltransferase
MAAVTHRNAETIARFYAAFAALDGATMASCYAPDARFEDPVFSLEGKDAVKEWTKGTWLKQFLAALEEPQRSEFEAEYARRVNAAYPPRADGRTLFPFRRLFIVMRRK